MCWYKAKKKKKGKLAQFKRAANAALWFGESFGLVPKQLTVCTSMSMSNEVINIPLGKSPEPPTDRSVQPAREVDEFCAMQTLYLLDKFGVSDEFYHKLTQVCHCHMLNMLIFMQHTLIRYTQVCSEVIWLSP